MAVLLLSTYDLGRQPFGVASPAAWLRRAGLDVHAIDLSRDRLSPEAVSAASLVAFYLPMHTATRLALPMIDRVRTINPTATICAYGLYAPLNEAMLREHGVSVIVGPEAEEELVRLALQIDAVLERAGFALVGVDGHQARPLFRTHEAPLAPRGKSRAAKAAQAAIRERGDDIVHLARARQAGIEHFVAPGRAIGGEILIRAGMGVGVARRRGSEQGVGARMIDMLVPDLRHRCEIAATHAGSADDADVAHRLSL